MNDMNPLKSRTYRGLRLVGSVRVADLVHLVDAVNVVDLANEVGAVERGNN